MINNSNKKILTPIQHSIFYKKLLEYQSHPIKTCIIYILPEKIEVKIDSILEITPEYITFAYTADVPDTPHLVEETRYLKSIHAIKMCQSIENKVQTLNHAITKEEN